MTARLCLLPLAAALLFAQAKSEWVWQDPAGKLEYRTDSRGNRIMDFSHAGYGGGGVRLPSPSVKVRVAPGEGDQTARLQAALDEAAGKAPAAVLLTAGKYEVAGTLTMTASGVVLRGEAGSVIQLTGRPHRFLEVHGSGTWQTQGERADILDDYVPVGATSLRVAAGARFRPGDRVLIERPVTEAWIHFMGMDTLVRDGRPQTWIKAGSRIRTDRTVQRAGGRWARHAGCAAQRFAGCGVRPRHPGPLPVSGTDS